MIYTANDYYSVKDYAQLCGVSPRNITDRIRAGHVRYLKISNFIFINVKASPPVRRIHRYRPVSGTVPSVQTFSFDGLREVGVFSRGKKFSEGIIYEAILTNKLDGYIIADKVFVKPVAAENFYRNRKKTHPLQPLSKVA